MSEQGPALGAYGIFFRYPRAEMLALEEITLELPRGQVTALYGPNGSGKSTLLRLMAGVLPLRGRDCSGVIRHRGVSFLELPPAARARNVAYIGPDLRAEFPLTAFEAVRMGRICHGMTEPEARELEAVRWAMDQTASWELRERDLHTLSGGERQLVGLARALVQGARTLLIDEAFSKMDLHHQALAGRVLGKLASEGYSILWVAHDLNLAASWSDRCFLLRSGRRIAEGPVAEVVTESVLRELYPGARLAVTQNPAGRPQVSFV